jgi:hypothetical protein
MSHQDLDRITVTATAAYTTAYLDLVRVLPESAGYGGAAGGGRAIARERRPDPVEDWIRSFRST